MAYSFVKLQNGGTEQYEDILISNVSVTKGEVLYIASGYASNATASTCTTTTVVGVASETVDNSGGSAGDLDCAILINSDALFEAPSVGVLAQSQVWTHVDLGSVNNFDEDDPKTTDAGVVHIRKLISTAKGLVRLNHYSPSDA